MISEAPVGTIAAWYTALLFSVMSIFMATQFSSLLSKITSHKNGIKLVRGMLKSSKPSQGSSKKQAFVWQTPIMFLQLSILLFIGGLMTLIFKRAVDQGRKGGLWTKDGKVSPNLA